MLKERLVYLLQRQQFASLPSSAPNIDRTERTKRLSIGGYNGYRRSNNNNNETDNGLLLSSDGNGNGNTDGVVPDDADYRGKQGNYARRPTPIEEE